MGLGVREGRRNRCSFVRVGKAGGKERKGSENQSTRVCGFISIKKAFELRRAN